jgi:hypothetical protein
MEIYVLSDRRLVSIAAWQEAINSEGFELALDQSRPFEQLRGHLPATWRGEHAGFECDHWEPESVLDGYPEATFGHRWLYCLAFRWGADARACLGAYKGATAYANATGGVVFDPDSGKVLTPPQARQIAQQVERDLPSFEQLMQSIVRRH